MGWYPKERITVLSNEPLAPSSQRTFQNQWPLDGCGWYFIRLHLSGILAAVATPFADGLYRFLKGITLKTSRGETIFSNVPGMAFFRWLSYFNHSQPFHDPLLAAGGTFCAVLDLPFVFPFLNRKEDTILDTGRYDNLELTLNTGSLAVFAPAAPATCPVTLGIELCRTLACKGDYEADGKTPNMAKPFALPYFGTYQNIALATDQQWKLTSSLDLMLVGFMISCQDVLLVEGAVPFCQPAAGGLDVLDDITFVDDLRTWVNAVPFESFREDRRRKLPYSWYDGGALPVAATEIPTSNLGIYPYNFIQNGSMNEAYSTGKKANIILRFNVLGAAGTIRADLLVWGFRTPR